MQTILEQKTPVAKPASSVGGLIDNNYALQLIAGFIKKFPGEVHEISIDTATIFASVKGLSHVSGVRFMYGMESAGDASSKIILLIPCNNTSGGSGIPNTIVQPAGYLNNKGERVGLRRTWELLYNHAIHYSRLLPEIKFNRVFRGDFFGIDSLTGLLKNDRRANSVKYNFGFDVDITEPTLRNKPLISPLSADGIPFDVFMDIIYICPPVCAPEDGSCAVTNIVVGNTTARSQEKELNIYRIYRDKYFLMDMDNGPLVEMYYYVSPALTEAILNTGRARQIYAGLYRNQVRQCNFLIKRGKYEEAKTLFEQTMEYLMKEYLFC